MTHAVGFDTFAVFTDAPHDIQKLHEVILQLAMQGKLTPQDPEDKLASYLLAKINRKYELEAKLKQAQTGSEKLAAAMVRQGLAEW